MSKKTFGNAKLFIGGKEIKPITDVSLTVTPKLIKADLGHNAGRHYKETLFEDGVEEPMLGYRHLVVYRETPNAVGHVRVSGRIVTPSDVKDLTDAEVRDKFDLAERELYECRYYNQQRIDRKKMGLE